MQIVQKSSLDSLNVLWRIVKIKIKMVRKKDLVVVRMMGKEVVEGEGVGGEEVVVGIEVVVGVEAEGGVVGFQEVPLLRERKDQQRGRM